MTIVICISVLCIAIAVRYTSDTKSIIGDYEAQGYAVKKKSLFSIEFQKAA